MRNASSTSTPVSKASKGIKALIATCFPRWTGRKVEVREVGPDWVHCQYQGDDTTAWLVRAGGHAFCQERKLGEPLVHRAHPDAVLAMHSRFMGQDMGVELIVPAGAIGAAELEAAHRALLAGDKRAAAKALETAGVFAGVALAMAEALVKGSRWSSPPAAAAKSARLTDDDGIDGPWERAMGAPVSKPRRSPTA